MPGTGLTFRVRGGIGDGGVVEDPIKLTAKKSATKCHYYQLFWVSMGWHELK